MSFPLEDQLAIQNLMARYARAVDVECTEEEFLALFTDDATMTSPVNGVVVGVEGLKRFREAFVKRRGKLQLRHTISNYIIDGDGDVATMKAYFVIYETPLDVPVPQRVSALRYCGAYDCAFRRVEGQWRMSRRDVVIDSQ